MKKLFMYIGLINDFNKIKKHFGNKNHCFSFIKKIKMINVFTKCDENTKNKLIHLMTILNYETVKEYVFKGKIED